MRQGRHDVPSHLGHAVQHDDCRRAVHCLSVRLDVCIRVLDARHDQAGRHGSANVSDGQMCPRRRFV